MESFPSEDLEKNRMSLDIGSGDFPAHQSLGLAWNINSDSFNCRIRFPVKPFTKRGILCVVNNLFHPLGFIELGFYCTHSDTSYTEK